MVTESTPAFFSVIARPMPPKPAPMIATLGARRPLEEPLLEASPVASQRPNQMSSSAAVRSSIARSASRNIPAAIWKSCHMPSYLS